MYGLSSVVFQGIKVLDGLITDRLEGTALSFGQGLIDIYSSSWGPTDDGRTVDGPGKLAREALKRGTSFVSITIFLSNIIWVDF